MMIKTFLSAVSSLTLFGTAAAYASAPGFSAGMWEVTRTVQGGPRSVEPQTVKVCISPEQLASDAAKPLKTEMIAPGEKTARCRASGATVDAAGNAKLTLSCKGPMGRMSTNLKGSYDARSFSTKGKMKMGPFSANISFSGRYLGKCS